MERKSFAPSGQSCGLNRTTSAQRENCRKILQFGRSTIPRLPPLVQHDIQVSTTVTSAVLSENLSQRDAAVCSSKQQPSSDILPRLERTPFKATAHFTLEKHVLEPSTTNQSKRHERPELRNQQPLNLTRENRTKKQEIPATSNGFVRGRRKKKDRLSSYECTSTEVIDEEISGFERRVGFDALSTTSPKCVKDMKGRMIRSSDIYGEGVSSLLSILDNEEDEKSKMISKNDPESDTPKIPKPSNPVRERFLKALDTHFYNEYISGQPGRRMAICEELEKLISGDGKTSLNGLREHLRLQDVLDSWVL